jgi:hypothetical protein
VGLGEAFSFMARRLDSKDQITIGCTGSWQKAATPSEPRVMSKRQRQGTRLMRLLPGQSFFQIKTTFPAEAVMEILRQKVTERHPLNPNPIPPSTPFRGGVYDREFEIKESVWFWHVYVPVFRGTIETAEAGSTVRVRVSNAYTSFTVGCGWAFSAMLFFIGTRMIWQGDFSGILVLLFALLLAVSQLFWTSWYLRKVESGKNRLQSFFVIKSGKRVIHPFVDWSVSDNDKDGQDEGHERTS